VLLGLVLVAVLAGAGYTLVSTIRVGNEALSTYADELILAWSLQEAHERKLASGRGFLIARDETLRREFETASTDTETVLAKLRGRVKSAEGTALLQEAARTLRLHDRALRDAMAMMASAEEISRRWATEVRPKASEARGAMDAFIHHKERLQDEQRSGGLACAGESGLGDDQHCAGRNGRGFGRWWPSPSVRSRLTRRSASCARSPLM
jgi:hypothetical protein